MRKRLRLELRWNEPRRIDAPYPVGRAVTYLHLSLVTLSSIDQ